MNREQINHISNRQHRRLQGQFKKAVEDFSVENIHQFRVAYKKLRSFLRMIAFVNKTTGEITISKKLKRAYYIAGLIRDLQLQRLRLQQATKGQPKKPAAYLNLLQKEINSNKPELSNIFIKNPVGENRKKTAAFFPHKFQPRDFKLYAQKKWAIIQSLLASGYISDDNMHSIRKCLKDLFYNLNLYKGGVHDKLLNSAIKVKDEQYFHELIEQLGNFQNSCTAISLFSAYPPNRVNKYNCELLERIKKKWMKDKAAAKRLLVEQLKKGIT